MNTSYLKTFIEVINMKNISKAAEKLFVTQPAVSKQLQILEKDFGSVLLKKDGRDIVPTEEGKILYQYSINLLNEEDKIYDKLRKDDSKLTGELCIYTSSLPADYYIHDLVMEFGLIYPEITYTIKKIDSKMVYNLIEDGIASFGFTGTPYKNNKISNICIAEDEVLIVGSSDKYNQYKNKMITIDLLMKQDFIIREKGSATLKTFENFLLSQNIDKDCLKVKIQAEDNELIKIFAKNGMGIAVISRTAVQKELSEGNLISIGVKGLELKRKLFYVYHADRYFSKIEEKFKEFIINKYTIG